MTYTVFGGTFNPAQSNLRSRPRSVQFKFWCYEVIWVTWTCLRCMAVDIVDEFIGVHVLPLYDSSLCRELHRTIRVKSTFNLSRIKNIYVWICLSVCLFVRQAITSKQLNVGWWNLAARCIVQKPHPSSNLWVITDDFFSGGMGSPNGKGQFFSVGDRTV